MKHFEGRSGWLTGTNCGLFFWSVWACLRSTLATIECHESQECAGTMINDTNVECYGYQSCINSPLIKVSAPLGSEDRLACFGAFSCYNATRIVSLAGSPIECEGLYSCAGDGAVEQSGDDILCSGESSCRYTTIKGKETQNVRCHGFLGCANSDLTSGSSTTFAIGGAYGTSNSILRLQGENAEVTFSGFGASDGITIVCESTCKIYCEARACDGLTSESLTCQDETTGCDFTYECKDTTLSHVCSDGFELSQEYDFPNVLHVASTQAEIFSFCHSPETLVCEDYQDSDCFNQTHFVSSVAVCCSGMEACDASQDITVNAAGSNGISLRVDGSHGANEVSGTIAASGTVYFSGAFASLVSSEPTVVTGTESNKPDVVVSGYQAWYEKLVRDVGNVYCLAPEACLGTSMSNINGDLYVYADEALRDEGGVSASTITNVSGSVYCNGEFACSGPTITNVEGNIIAVGSFVMLATGITNAKTVIAYGDAALRQAAIFQVGTLIVGGPDDFTSAGPLSKAEVTSDGGQDGVMNIIIDGNENPDLEVSCFASDVCNIVCKSVLGCSDMTLNCVGTCNLDCANSYPDSLCPFKDPNVPSGGILNYVSLVTEAPTKMPTVVTSEPSSASPSNSPSSQPTNNPSTQPSIVPTKVPSTGAPSNMPSNIPSDIPSDAPTTAPVDTPAPVGGTSGPDGAASTSVPTTATSAPSPPTASPAGTEEAGATGGGGGGDNLSDSVLITIVVVAGLVVFCVCLVGSLVFFFIIRGRDATKAQIEYETKAVELSMNLRNFQMKSSSMGIPSNLHTNEPSFEHSHIDPERSAIGSLVHSIRMGSVGPIGSTTGGGSVGGGSVGGSSIGAGQAEIIMSQEEPLHGRQTSDGQVRFASTSQTFSPMHRHHHLLSVEDAMSPELIAMQRRQSAADDNELTSADENANTENADQQRMLTDSS